MARQTNRHIDSPAALGERLRRARVAAGLRQRDLAFDGCSISYISRLEKGDRQPSLQLVEQLALKLGVTVEWLARNDETPRAPAEDERLLQAEIALRVGETDEGLALVRDTLASDPPKAVAARGEALLGQAAFTRDDAHQAIAHLERAIELDDALALDPATADTLGRAYARIGEMESAISLFRRNLDLAHETGDALEHLRFTVLLANALIDSSQLGEASVLLAGAIGSSASDDPVALARIYWTQSRLHSMKREPRLARRFARRALDLLERTEYLQYRSRAYQLMAFTELDSGDPDTAIEYIRRGRELAREVGTTYDEAKLAIEEARALAKLGRYEEAATAAINASSGLREGHPADIGRGYTELATIFAEAGQPERALELYELAIELLEPTPNRFLADAYSSYGDLLERMGRQEAAFATFRKAAHLNTQLHQVAETPATS